MDLTGLLIFVPVLLFSVIAHEYAHGYAALRQGDQTALMLGRLTWNPLKHIDPMMTIIVPAMLWIGSGGKMLLGGAKPVPVNPRNYRSFKRGDIIVSLAGVATNLVIAVACALLFPLFGLLGRSVASLETSASILQAMMVRGLLLNLVLIVFNLIPIPPLDGSHVMKYAARRVARHEIPAARGLVVPIPAGLEVRDHRAHRADVVGAPGALRRDVARVQHLSVDDGPAERIDSAIHAAVARPMIAPAGMSTPTAADNGPQSFIVELTAFSGPLDLLLTLIREEQVDIYDIPIARVAEQFLLRIRTLELNEAADYLEMAARLLRIKAQMLLPRGDEELWEDR